MNAPAIVARQITAVADHLTQHRPNARMTDAARMTIAVSVTGSRAPAVRPLLGVLPFPTGGITRGEYALRIRRTAWSLGHQADAPDPNWTPGPVIPRFPGPRLATAGGTR